MKRIIFFLILMISMTAATRENYRPLLKDGKVWHCYSLYNGDACPTEYLFYIKGDTIIGGEKCYKLYQEVRRRLEDVGYESDSDNSYYYAMQEKDGKVYRVMNEKSKYLLYDFSVQVGDTLSYIVYETYNGHPATTQTLYVDSIDSIQTSAGILKRICMKSVYTNYFSTSEIYEVIQRCYLVEGVGYTWGPVLSVYSGTGIWEVLTCVEDGQSISTFYDYNFEKYAREPLSDVRRGALWRYVNEYGYGEDFLDRGRGGEIALQESGNGKKYHRIHYRSVVHGNCYAEGVDGHYLLLREADGRWLVEKGKYLDYAGKSADIPYQETAEGELLLYDFTLQVGDRWPLADGREELTVVKADEMVMDYDYAWSKPRRRLTLSNGLVVVEGIGCVNSPGMLFRYLNPSPSSQVNSVCLQCYEDYTSQWHPDKSSLLQPLGITSIHSSGNSITPCFDLQGRRLNGVPTKGMYIKDGKKHVVR